MADKRFVSDKSLTFNCDLDFGRGNLNFVSDILSHFALSFCKVRFDSLYCFFSYG